MTYSKTVGDETSAWADAPAASVVGDAVSWDLSSVGELEKGVTYTVTFKVRPNEAAYNKAAENGQATEFDSNNADGTKLFYKTLVKMTGQDDKVSDEKTDSFEMPRISVPVNTLAVSKAWANTDGASVPDSVTLQLKKDGVNYGDVFQLTANDNWVKSIVVPAGPGSYTWSVEETAIPGYDTTYGSAHTFTVGAAGAVGSLAVTNSYHPSEVTLEGDTAIKGTKTLNGRDAAGNFTFKLSPETNYGENVEIAEGADVATVSGAKDGVATGFSFGAITFKKAGTYTFDVVEQGTAPAGYTYDTHTSKVTVTVSDSGNGKLAASIAYDDGSACVFKNSYRADPVTVTGSANFAFAKELTGRSLKAGEFSFTVSAGKASPENTPLPRETTVSNNADGSFAFGDITFTKVGTYYYDIAEETSNLPSGVSAVTEGSKQVTVTVTDNGAGKLEAEVEAPDNKVFKNAYEPEDAQVQLALTKELVAEEGFEAPALQKGAFTFTIKDKAGKVVSEATNDASGSVQFEPIAFTKADLVDDDGKPVDEKTFNYTVSESGSMPGVKNDSAKSFTITVSDKGDGSLSAVASAISSFVNTYSAEPATYSVTQGVKVSKELSGRALQDREFSFELVENGEVVQTAVNDAAGAVSFNPIEYDKPGVHNYVIRETAGQDGNGVTCDKASYLVTVRVSDEGTGKLTAEVVESPGSIVFKNSYSVVPATVVPGAVKVLKGGQLSDGQFSFQLKDEQGAVVETAKNSASGAVVFDALNFTEEGTYRYTLSEVNDGQENMSYDGTVYDLAIVVTDSGKGALTAEYQVVAQGSDEYLESSPVFTNVYTAPEPEPGAAAPAASDGGSSAPQTGDTMVPLAIAGLVALLAVIAAIASRKALQRGKHRR